ncbi:hypothetical protein CORC01_08393 [Colletotrichum orchidophilum]|uniref:Uncharacterized protein n=1 Tax=Colletotrichum orchidophilum TaxID=1209926 RepID=A0A1G4B4H8_9PEZI|nr:uncharacterized protein CORC01_08393 [Colletotrichum orchidophilum]OHE96321.1 hypothetical protein CORC01_08393 [Colletotrichum orchidophilum]
MAKLRGLMCVLLASTVANASLVSFCRSAFALPLPSVSDSDDSQSLATASTPQGHESASAEEVVPEQPQRQLQDDVALHQMPSAEASFQATTITIVRTVTIELADRTEFVWSPVQQTLTFINPTLVFETTVVTASRPPDIAAREEAKETSLERGVAPATSSVYPHGHEGAGLSPHPARIRRQTPASITRVSTITVEITTTIVASGTSVRTVTIFNPVFVSVTQTPTLTTTIFTTTTLPLEYPVSSVPAVAPAPPASQSVISSDDTQQTVSSAGSGPTSLTRTTLAASGPQKSSVASSTLGTTGTGRVRSPSDTSFSLSADDHQMTSATAASTAMNQATATPPTYDGPCQTPQNEDSSKSSEEEDVRKRPFGKDKQQPIPEQMADLRH